MKTAQFGALVLLVGLPLSTWAAGEGTREEKQLAVDRILAAYDEAIDQRTLAQYVAQEYSPEIGILASRTIERGEMILGGRAVAAPYEISFGRAGITVNGLGIVPRFRIAGTNGQLGITAHIRETSEVAELIAKRKDELLTELGDCALVIPELAVYARSFDLVSEVVVEGSTAKVTFLQEEGETTQEVGYVCRETQRAEGDKEEADALRAEYSRICDWLEAGNCVFVPVTGAIRFEEAGLVDRLDTAVGGGANLETRLHQNATTLAGIADCFGTPATKEDAALVLANWRR